MTRTEKVAEAQRLRGEGLKFREIAERMGCSVSTVNDYINDPTRAKAVARKRSYAGTCQDCGGATDGSNGQDAAPARCLTCRRSINQERNQLLVEMWEAGVPTWYIAQQLEMTESAVINHVDFERRKRGGDLPLRRLGGNATQREARHRQIIKWRRDGLSNREIADRLGTTTESVSQSLTFLRKKGWDVPPRRALAAKPEQILPLWNSDLTVREIAKALGYSNSKSLNNRVACLRAKGFDIPRRRSSRVAVA